MSIWIWSFEDSQCHRVDGPSRYLRELAGRTIEEEIEAACGYIADDFQVVYPSDEIMREQQLVKERNFCTDCYYPEIRAL